MPALQALLAHQREQAALAAAIKSLDAISRCGRGQDRFLPREQLHGEPTQRTARVGGRVSVPTPACGGRAVPEAGGTEGDESGKRGVTACAFARPCVMRRAGGVFFAPRYANAAPRHWPSAKHTAPETRRAPILSQHPDFAPDAATAGQVPCARGAAAR